MKRDYKGSDNCSLTNILVAVKAVLNGSKSRWELTNRRKERRTPQGGEEMSSINVVRVDDGIEFHVFETKVYGIPDGQRVEKVSFDPAQSIPNLPDKVAEVDHGDYRYTVIYWIAERNQWVGFNFTSCQERSTGPNDEDYYGPYLVPNELPPTEEELAEAEKVGTLPCRCKKTRLAKGCLSWKDALYKDGQLIKAHRRG